MATSPHETSRLTTLVFVKFGFAQRCAVDFESSGHVFAETIVRQESRLGHANCHTSDVETGAATVDRLGRT